MDEYSIYDIVYDKTAEKCLTNGVSMPFSKEVYDNWIGKDPLIINEREFDIYLNDGGSENIKNYAMYRCMGKVVYGHVDDIYAFVVSKLESDMRAVVDSLVTILNHSTPARECGLQIAVEGRYRPDIRERWVILSFLIQQRIKTITSILRQSLKKGVVEPVWDSFSNESKNKIRVFFGREAKP